MQRIEAPNGDVVEFPDDMVDADIETVMRREYGGADAASTRISGAFDAAAEMPEQTLTSRKRALAEGAAQGATLGFGDEIGAALDLPVSALFGGNAGGEYSKNLDQRRTALKLAQAERPGYSIGGEVAGALATAPVTPFLRAAQGAGWLRRAGASAVTGTGYGAAYGLGTGEGGLVERAPSALYGAAGGAAGGAIASPLSDLAISGASKLYSKVRAVALPFTRKGAERAAGETLRDAAADPTKFRADLQVPPDELVPGSVPTTFQATGDLRIGELEKQVATLRPGDFAARRGEQNAARLSSLEAVQSTGYSEAVSGALRKQLAELDRLTDETISDFTTAAQARAQQLGGELTPESYGESLRTFAVGARDAANRTRKALYDAVDPTGTMVLPGNSIASAAREIAKELTPSARPMAGEEAAIFNVAREYGERVRFADVRQLRSRVGQAMAEERRVNGQSPVYRRLVMLRGSIDRSLDGLTQRAATSEQRAIRAGRLSPDLSIGSRLAAASQGAAPDAGTAVFTPSGQRLDVQYQVVDAGSLIPSNLPDMTPNPRFPSELQPRDRTRVASEVQVNRIASELEPERLGASSSAGEGAPIVGPDGVVESGNARVLGILRAYEGGGPRADAYRAFLQAQGFDVAGMKSPVLIRRRVSDLDAKGRAAFTREANVSPGLAMSASERAAMDAERIPDNLLDAYRGSDIGSASNRGFVRGFLQAVARPSEEGAFVTRGGELSQEGAQRVRNALLHTAYEDSPLVASLAESADDGLRAFGGALTDAAGDVARIRRAIRSGALAPDVEIGRAGVEAANVVKDARQRGLKVGDLVAQQNAFEQISEEAKAILRAAYGPDLRGRVSRSSLAEFLNAYNLEASQQTTEARLFGQALSSAEIIANLEGRHVGRGAGASDAFAPGGPAYGSGGGEAGAGVGRSGGVPYQPEDAGAGGRSAQILGPEDTAATAELDPAAVARLREANAFNAGFKSTYDKGAVGNVVASAGGGEYRILASAVPQRILATGPRGFETVQAYRRAVGDGEAMLVLQDYAASSLRAIAERADGTLDPAKVANWRTKHADALRAFPELDQRFAGAAQASEAIAAAAVTRKAALDQFQKGVAGKMVNAGDPETAARTIGQMFNARDGALQLRRLATALGNDTDGREGLRKLVVDYVLRTFVGNAEAATAGLGTIKSDAFQTFVKRNAGALRSMFSETEIRMMQNVAADLQRANLSIVAVKNPGGSDTAQNLAAGGRSSLLFRVMRETMRPERAIGGAAGFGVGGPLGLVAGLVGAEAARAMMQAGVQRVDDLVADALLNPTRARALLERIPDRVPVDLQSRLARLYKRGAIIPSAQAMAGENAESAFDPEKRKPAAIIGIRNSLERTDPAKWRAVKKDYTRSVIADALDGPAPTRRDMPGSTSHPVQITTAGVLRAALLRETVQANLKAAMSPEEWDRTRDIVIVLGRASSLGAISSQTKLRQQMTAETQDRALPLLRLFSDAPNAIEAIRALASWQSSSNVGDYADAMADLATSEDPEVVGAIKTLRRLSPLDRRWPVVFGHLLSRSAAFGEPGPLPMAVGQ